MQNVSPIHFDDDDQESFDDLDALFDQLERFEPPSDMVEQIMGAVSKLPPPQWHVDGPVTHYDDRQSS
ncbi:MAG: hypothetical protein NVS2B12_01020 [Ktedonobacteraceae bacterium]